MDLPGWPPLILSFVLLGFLLGDYNVVWSQPENLIKRQALLWRDQGTLWSQILAGFDWSLWENGAPRLTRPLSSFLDLANAHFRVWFHATIFPHPSVSLTWIASLLLAPWFLFKAMRHLGLSAFWGLCGVGIYLSLPGQLSLMAMDFRGGKAALLLLMILMVYFLARARAGGAGRFGAWALVVYGISLGTDETALYGLALIFALLDYRRIRDRWLAALSVLISAGYYFVIKSVLPAIHHWAGYPLACRSSCTDGSYDMQAKFLDLVLLGPDVQTYAGIAAITAKNAVLAIWNMGGLGLLGDPQFWPKGLLPLAFLALLLGAGLATRRVPVSPGGGDLGRFAALLAVGLVCHGVLMSLTTHPLWGSYWYGGYLGLPFALFLICVLKRYTRPTPLGHGVAGLLVMLLIASNFTNFRPLNYTYKDFHYYPWRAERLSRIFAHHSLKFDLARARGERFDLRALTREFARQAPITGEVSLPRELGYLAIETNPCPGPWPAYRITAQNPDTIRLRCLGAGEKGRPLRLDQKGTWR